MFIRHNKGTALLTTLLVLSFAAITITALVNIQQLLMYRTEQTVHSLENFQYAMGVEDWAKGRLFAYANTPKEDKNSFTFPQILPSTSIPYGSIDGELMDAEGAFNINNLKPNQSTAVQNQKNFVNGLIAIYPDVTEEKAGALYQLIYNQFNQNNGGINAQFLSSTELRASNLLTPAEFDDLSHWTIALPTTTKLSINTASAEAIIMASAGKIDKVTAQAMVEARNEIGWITSLDQLKDNDAFSKLETYNIDFGLEPTHFWIITTIRERKSTYRLYTLLKVSAAGGTMDELTLWRSYGTR